MKQLIHSGVRIPKRYEPKGFHIKISGEQVALTPHQEEMAVAWVKKLGTDCVKDPVFIKNFFHDFSAAMETSDKPLSPEQVDFSEIIAFVEKEKQIKANMSKEEKKKQAQERKVLREANKEKYIWLSDSSQAKQEKEIEKFDKAKLLDKKIGKLKEHIFKNLQSEDAKKRKTATVAFLIDELKLRVGDEKHPDEADTVGATTLRPSHVTISSVNKVSFDFLGKDSVRWQREVEVPEIVVQNISEF